MDLIQIKLGCGENAIVLRYSWGVIDGDVFRKAFTTCSTLSASVCREFTTFIDKMIAAQLSHRAMGVRQRIIAMLMSMRSPLGCVDEKGTLQISLPISRQQLALYLGTTPESISRAIRELRDDNIALFKGRTVLIPNIENALNVLTESDN